MNGFVRAALLCTLVAGCSNFALADSVSVNGNVSFTPGSLTFAPPFTSPSDTGIFAGFSNGVVSYLLGTVDYMGGIAQPEEAFYITAQNGDVLAFWDARNNAMQTLDANGNLEVTMDEVGWYTLNGGPAMSGTFNLSFDGTTPSGSQDNVAFYGSGSLTQVTSTAVTPEPSSFLLLGTGFLGAATLLRRRKASL